MSSLIQLARSKFASLRITGPDQKGIVAASSQILDKYGCAIMKSEQFTDPTLNYFYQRSIFHPHQTGASFHQDEKLAIHHEINQLKDRFGLDLVNINWRDRPKRMAVFVSKYDHCLVSIVSPTASYINVSRLTFSIAISNESVGDSIATRGKGT